MDLQGQNITSTETSDFSLPLNTELSGKYQVTGVVSENEMWITYLALDSETNEEVHIQEFFPKQTAVRSEDGVSISASDEKQFRKQKKMHQTAAKRLMNGKIPHLNVSNGYFEENGTFYLVFQVREAVSLKEADIPITSMYLRSLALALCDTYSSLHKLGYCYGNFSSSQIMLCPDGKYYLQSYPIFEALSNEADLSLDLYVFTSALSELFLLSDSDAESQTDPSPYDVMKNVLKYRYHNAALLKDALICPENSLAKPRTFASSGKSVFRAFLCISFLLFGTALVLQSGITKLPLGICMKLGLVRPDVVSVWMPLDDTADEDETIAMYKKLTAGFERKYAGYGVNLVIYAGDSFSEAMQFADNAEPPTVFMNTDPETVNDFSSDLSPLTRSLEKKYFADMHLFENAVPLGCSLPALYYNAYSYEQIEAETIELSEIDASVCYDASVSAFITSMEKDALRKEGVFSEFMDSRSDIPFLASTACLSVAERNGIASGAIKMLPVSVDGTYPLQYEMYCTVNEQKDWNSRCIGMLWLQYLLTEEAQQIMFAENYSTLPMHTDVLPQTIENHDALSVLNDISPDFNTTAIQ